MGAFVAHDGRWRGELCQTEAMAAQETRNTGFGELGGACDLEAWEPAAAQGEHAGHPERVGLAHGPATACPVRRRLGGSGGTFGARTAVVEAREAFGAKAGEPLVGAALGNPKACGDGRDGLVEIDDAFDHLGSTERGEFGLTVRVHAAVVLGWVLFHIPTFPSPRRMNNLLELHI